MIVRLPSPDIRSLAPSDHRTRPAPLVPVENQGSYTHPTVAEVASPFLSSLSDAKSKLQPTSKIARKCTAFLRLQPLNSPTRFSEDPKIEIRIDTNGVCLLFGDRGLGCRQRHDQGDQQAGAE